jgi:hypothetical protein
MMMAGGDRPNGLNCNWCDGFDDSRCRIIFGSTTFTGVRVFYEAANVENLQGGN